MAKKIGPNKENLEATRKNFLQIASEEFASKGYYDTSTAVIVEKSGMARGSLYYHFGDKKGLFQAVYEQLMYQIKETIRVEIETTKEARQALINACLAFLDVCTQSSTRRIIIDVHTALTYPERIAVLQKTLLSELRVLIDNARAAGYFKQYDPQSLMIIIFSMISEGGRSFEISSDVKKSRELLGRDFVLFMERASA
ncbi:MAG: hypothetical protein DI626_07165 [Micavibrio aeruginosavorus]|uniref:HTH tetR-type domain-containing protein n=1 Tax=Micavibrio aeruginosavorus TaxID=349221 RepID=A0A2W4ZXD6_9BACT|nr:MAG: hypothetical protein DI626_07165 [Micavibrio aeruginosavorus]